ncbi:MAG: AarF/ABC1/UbiB kinase family protein [Eggerthellaceae bacterium]|nr:AarF/ABC1/UbiB kinase family protein [Eggerthellaceae bacterium]
MADVNLFMRKARRRSKEEKAESRARFKEILAIVKKYDLKEGLTPEMTVDLIQDLGTTFVKLGQIASTHPDVLPMEYCEALGALRTHARPLDFADVKAQVENELGKPVEELFAEFDETPLGSASIAQVHRAVLPTGEVVAVKVQRPGIVETVTNDLAILERLVEILDAVNKSKGGLSLKELVAELVKTSMEELDFANEEANLDRFYANNEPREKVTSPKCYRDYSTSAILTEDFVSAPAAEDIETLGKTDEERDEIAYLVAHNFMEQIMADGFYHADPHAGNVMITEDNGIEWIDFGMMGTMTGTQRDTVKDLILALVKGDSYRLKRAVLKVATPTGPVDHAALLEMCEDVTGQFVDVDLDEFDTGALISSLTSSCTEVGMDVDPFLTNLGRGLVTLEGTIHHISPRLNIMTVLVDYLKSSFDPNSLKRVAADLAGRSADSAAAMAALPTRIDQTLDMVQKGHVKVGMELSSNERFSKDIRAAAGLVAIALVAVGLVIGACILGASTNAVTLGGVPLFGGLGLIAGVALAIYVFMKTRPFLK